MAVARSVPAKDQHAAGALAVDRGVRVDAGRRASWGQLGPLVGLSKPGCTSCARLFRPNAHDILIHVRLSAKPETSLGVCQCWS